MTYVPTTVTSNSVSILVGDSMRSITDSHSHYQDIRLAIKEERYDDAISLLDIAKQIVDFAGGKVEVKGGIVYYNGRAVNNGLTARILTMKDEGFNIDPMTRLLENLMENPSYRSVTQLYGFLEACTLPITDDGHFMAYKIVRDNFTDHYTGKFDNSPGKVVEVPRNEVDEDPDRTCSNGLHVCSEGYLGKYGHGCGSVVILVKVNPRDVVAVPKDYNNAKMRVCRYEVIRQASVAINKDNTASEWSRSVVNSTGDDYATATTSTATDGAPFRSVRNEADGTVTALFTFDVAATRLCPAAVDSRGALRKRLSRGSATEETFTEGSVVLTLIRCPLTAAEVDQWRAHLDADSEEEYDDDTIDGDFYNDYT